MKKNHPRAGFTLIETLLYFSLVSALMVSVMSLFITLLETKTAAHALSRVERNSQFIQARLAYDIRRAQFILEPSDINETTSVLILRIDGQDVTYEVLDGQLVYRQGAQTSAVQTETTMNQFSVQRIGKVGQTPTVRLQYEIQGIGQTAQGSEIQSYQSTVGIR